MALTQIALKPKTHRGKGGGIGSIVGTVVGGVAGGIAGIPGGPAGIAAGATGGAAAGGALGNATGNLIDPSKSKETRGVSTLETAAKLDPQVQAAQLADAVREIRQTSRLNQPQKEELLSTINPAMEALRRNMGAA